MPTISQEGVYVAGTYGFPITCRLAEVQTGIFSDVTAIELRLTRPDGSAITPRSLPLPDSIVDPDRTIQWIAQSGDLSIDGVYQMQFAIDYVGGAHLIFGGDFKVTEE
jgi:hypothetical protein